MFRLDHIALGHSNPGTLWVGPLIRSLSIALPSSQHCFHISSIPSKLFSIDRIGYLDLNLLVDFNLRTRIERYEPKRTKMISDRDASTELSFCHPTLSDYRVGRRTNTIGIMSIISLTVHAFRRYVHTTYSHTGMAYLGHTGKRAVDNYSGRDWPTAGIRGHDDGRGERGRGLRKRPWKRHRAKIRAETFARNRVCHRRGCATSSFDCHFTTRP